MKFKTVYNSNFSNLIPPACPCFSTLLNYFTESNLPPFKGFNQPANFILKMSGNVRKSRVQQIERDLVKDPFLSTTVTIIAVLLTMFTVTLYSDFTDSGRLKL